ncbi:MAG: hypothetical protein H7Y60_05680 [Rhodospirillaceae bacterium]|nr:hypothetical protein [Rhodospirillales bacterium]
MPMTAPLRFAFSDGCAADGPTEMSVTYLGRISRKKAEADARRRFEEWCRLPSHLSRRWSKDQVVVS